MNVKINQLRILCENGEYFLISLFYDFELPDSSGAAVVKRKNDKR